MSYLCANVDLQSEVEHLISTWQYTSALERLEAIPVEFVEDPDIYRLKAICHQRLAEWGLALDVWRKVLACDPQQFEAVVNIGVCLLKQGNSEQAEIQMQLAAETFPDCIDAQFNWYSVQLQKEGPEAVIKAIAELAGRVGNREEFTAKFNNFKVKLISLYDPMDLLNLDSGNILELNGNAGKNASVCESLPSLEENYGAGLEQHSIALPSGDDNSGSLNTTDLKYDYLVENDHLEGELDSEIVPQCDDNASEEPAPDWQMLYETFESLGENCEFGLVQRQHKAEPISLFRWTGLKAPPASNMIKLLRTRLVDYDQAEHYQLIIGENGDYVLESIYNCESHTFVNSSEIAADVFLKRLILRQTFLKRKFLEDITTGSKIYLFKSKNAIDPDELDEMQGWLMTLGARKFLFVAPATPEQPGGSVLKISDTRVMGYLSDFMPRIQFSEWDRIITATYDHFSRGCRDEGP